MAHPKETSIRNIIYSIYDSDPKAPPTYVLRKVKEALPDCGMNIHAVYIYKARWKKWKESSKLINILKED